MKGYALAIDGPVAAGKGTVAGLLAKKLHGFHLNTGAMYRCVALYCLENKINVAQKDNLIASLAKIKIELESNMVTLNGINVTEKIKQRVVSQLVPEVAAINEVREEMVRRQRAIGLQKIASGHIVLAEGRDAATKIFPDAYVKIFLTAKPEVRAKRRFEQMGDKQTQTISFEEILADTKKRDYKDTHRSVDPLVNDPEKFGYFVLDDSNMNEEQTLDEILKEIDRRTHDKN